MPMIEHKPVGTGVVCTKCKQPAASHRSARKRLWHPAKGDPCKTCGKAAKYHPGRKRLRARKKYDAKRDDRKAARRIIAIDGEGRTLSDGRHAYVYMAAVDEHGRTVGEVRNEQGLTHDECVDFLLKLPRNTLKFGFGFGYDITKIIEGLKLEDRYYIVHPEARRRFVCKRCRERWGIELKIDGKPHCHKCGSTEVRQYTASLKLGRRRYGYTHGAFTVGAGRKKSCHIWDAIGFFRSSLVEALTDWSMGSPDERALIARMKAARQDFAHVELTEIEHYCRLECHLLAKMMRKLVDAAARIGLKLSRYDGAGALAAALLKKHKVERYLPRIPLEPALEAAVRAALFGGRFEQSVVGEVRDGVCNHDISGAYPAALADMPCLKCGKWEYVEGRGLLTKIRRAHLACVRFTVRRTTTEERKYMHWAPLPCRDDKGSLIFGTGFSGWAWKPEVLAAMNGWPGLIELHGAWIYKARCNHRPFKFMHSVYAERVRLGEDAAGKVFKSATNAVGGKLWQSVGSAKYRNEVWAGNMTSVVRARMIELMARHGDRVLAVATDGLCARGDLGLNGAGLGGWKTSRAPDGVFFARPGLFFRLDYEEARARGLSRSAWLEHAPAMLEAWRRWDRKNFEHNIVVTEPRFIGAKAATLAHCTCPCGESWVGVPDTGCPACGGVPHLFHAGLIDERYGQWVEAPIKVSLDPFPKRERHLRKTGSFSELRVRDLGGVESVPYTSGMVSPEAEAAGVRDRELD